MGDVYRGREPEMGDRWVAIKVPKANDVAERAQRRFAREISASARLQHVNIVRAYSRGIVSGRPYLVMEYVAGRRLNEVVGGQHPLAPRRAARIILGIARGLEHAAKQGVVNRDLKPENVILADPDETPKILDYGLALISGPAEQVTRDGSLLGTPSYAAPEQFRDPHSVGIAADVYALGCTAYFCLAGRPPYVCVDFDELVRLHREAPRPSLVGPRPDVPDDLDRLVQWMMTADSWHRPSPAEVIRQIERLLPSLSEQRPVAAAPLKSDTLDVTCPGCHTAYHVGRELAGKSLRCPNPVCHKVFVVAATDAGEVVYDAAFADDEPLEAELVDPALDSSVRVVPAYKPPSSVSKGEAKRGGPPPPATAPTSVPDDLDTLPIGEVVDMPDDAVAGPSGAAWDTPPPPPLPETPGAAPAASLTSRRKRDKKGKAKRGWLSRLRWPVAVLATTACVALIWYYWPRKQPDPQWQAAMQEFQDHKWSSTKRKLEKFAEEHPDDARVAAIPFFNDMSDAGDHIYSTTGDPVRGLAAVQKVFQEHRDNQAYKDYSIELYQAAARLVERFTAEAAATQSMEQLDRARQAAALLQTVAASRAEDWIPERNRELLAAIERAERSIDDARARAELVSLLTAAGDTKSRENPDNIYAKVGELLRQHTEWAADQEIQKLREAAYAAEPARVDFVMLDGNDSLTAEREEHASVPADYDRLRQGNTVAVVWGDGSSATDAARVMALARGVLYAFDAGGKLCWSRRLGVDVDRLPQPMPATATSPPALIALSTEDNTLLALNRTNGQVLWRYHVGKDIAAPLLIVLRAGAAAGGRLGLLPTADGEIHVIELVLGRRLGKIVIGQPLTVGGAYDPETALAYFPADAKRIYAIDVAAVENERVPVCPSILFSDHASGSLRAPPVCVGPYLILCESSGLEHTRLRAFRVRNIKDDTGVHKLGFARPTDGPLKELQLRGWTWFAPHTTPDRITLVTDQGELGLFGLNLDYTDEAIYPLVGDPRANPAALTIPGQNDARALAVDAQEHLLWIMAGGKLRKFSIDLLRQKVNSLWQAGAAEISGAAAHEAQTDQRGSLYLTTMSPSGRVYQASAVDAESGALRWQRRLGINVFGAPLVGKDLQGNDRVVLVDDSGRAMGLVPSEKLEPSDVVRLKQLQGDEAFPAGADEQRLMLLGEPPGTVYLAVPLNDGAKLAIKHLDFKPPVSAAPGTTWTTLTLPGRLAGRPCLSGDRLVVPCDDGQIYRRPLNGGPADGKDVSATWRPKEARFASAEVELWPVNERDVMAIVGGRIMQKFILTDDNGMSQLRRAGEPLSFDRPLRGRPLIANGRALVFDDAGTLIAVDLAAQPGTVLGKWPLGLQVTAGPVLRGKQVVAVVDERRLVALPVIPPSDMKKPLWTSDEFQGRIQGLPTLAGDVLLVADNSRRVSGVRITDGTTLWRAPLRVRSGPSAAPAPYGRGRMLVPLVDGTLLLVPVPKAEDEVSP